MNNKPGRRLNNKPERRLLGKELSEKMNLVQMSLTAGILIIGIIIFRILFMNYVPKKAMILLWEIAILRLVLPIALPMPFPGLGDLGAISLDCYKVEAVSSVFVDVPSEKVCWKVAHSASVWDGEETAVISVTENGDTAAASGLALSMQKSNLPWMIYGVAALVMILGSLYLYYRDSQFFREGLPMSEKEKQLLLLLLEERDRERMKRVKFCISDRTASPVTYGVFRPAIVFPKGLYQNSEKEIAFWLRHELVHIRHHDNLKKLVAHGVLCLHWFNPLVWLMVLLFNRDMEILCDETVVRNKQESRKDYALALLSMAQQKSMGFQTGLGFGKNAVTERITAVMKFRKVTARGILGAMAAVGMALTAFGSHYDVSYAAGSNAAVYEYDGETSEYAVIATDTIQEDSGLSVGGYTNVAWENMPGIEMSFVVVEDAAAAGAGEETVTGDTEYAVSAAEYTDSLQEQASEQISPGSADQLMDEKTIEDIVIEDYGRFGVSIWFEDTDYQLFYEGEPIYFLADNTIPEEEGFSGRLFLNPSGEKTGTTGVVAEHDQSGNIVGLRHLSEKESKEYTRRWR